jgi:hypothetical protein
MIVWWYNTGRLEGAYNRCTYDDKHEMLSEKRFKRSNVRSEYNMIIDLKGHVDWIHLSQDCLQWRSVLNTIVNFQVPETTLNFLINWAIVGFSRSALLRWMSMSRSWRGMENCYNYLESLIYSVFLLFPKLQVPVCSSQTTSCKPTGYVFLPVFSVWWIRHFIRPYCSQTYDSPPERTN